MKQKFYFIFIILFVLFSPLFAKNKQKILFCSEYYNNEQKLFVKKNKLQNVYVFYHNDFINDVTSDVDKKMFANSINKIIPNLNDTAFAVIDWEDYHYTTLITSYKVTREYSDAINKYIDLIKYAKSLRPKVKWSFYALPPKGYPLCTTEYKRRLEFMIPLLKELDFLNPSLYLLDDSTEVKKGFIEDFLKSNLCYSIELAKRLNKPLYPFIWNRYSPHSKRSGNKNIDKNYFKKYVRLILNYNYADRNVDGVIWWTCESFIYSNTINKKINLEEYKNVKNPMKYQIELLQRYYDLIK